ncbi:hypothetical protein MBCUT_01980 [Methanobrevibacter cuticularis]|uniref:Uncharacterized protein n=1 Tax=Methanobrevibacter cuticularis TaxID=47311 RepID=A0A166FC70_9EURY|nr:hypothetical protein [Methanobrevibacter cuticularis]KZX17523.1 hypothetical protein MBCUT_01980 [Methanobrevibacter cuticularis]
MIEIKQTSIQIPKDTLIKIKAIAVEKGTTQNKVIIDFINKGLENTEPKNRKVKARIISDELPEPKTKTKTYKSLKDMAGIVKVDKNIDVDEVLGNIHMKKGLY